MLVIRKTIPFLLIMAALTFFIFAHEGKTEKPYGKIVDITWDKEIYAPGDVGKFYVNIKNNSNSKKHYLVAMEIQDPKGNSIYDSHRGKKSHNHDQDDCRDIWLDRGENATVGPFIYHFSRSNPSGRYTVVAGLRIYPWEPAADFRGADWCLPVEKFSFRK